MSSPKPASAIIDGTLCQIDRTGTRSRSHQPLGSAVVEFRQGALCYFVREHPYGLLPGIPNLYCLGADLQLLWLPAWPDLNDLCAGIVEVKGEVLTVRTVSGAQVRLDTIDGRILGWSKSEKAAG